MPSRRVLLFIAVFWVGSTAWMFYREAWPRMSAGEPPPIRFDMVDEFRMKTKWKIYCQGEYIGSVRTSTVRNLDQTYRLHAHYFFETYGIHETPKKSLDLFRFIGLQKFEHALLVTPKGELLQMTTTAKLRKSAPAWKAIQLVQQLNTKPDRPDNLDTFRARIDGKTDGKELSVQLAVTGLFKSDWTQKLPSVDLPSNRRILNTMHPLHSISHLRHKQTWVVPKFDPIGSLIGELLPKGSFQKTSIPEMVATVEAATLEWERRQVECWRIDYRAQGETNPMAHTWVRRKDGIVLQQQAKFLDRTMTLVRTKYFVPFSGVR